MGSDNARYTTLPELSPYTRADRYEQPKETFKAAARRLHELTSADEPLRLADVACANGELLYFIRREFPRWKLHGFDYEPKFLDVARAQPTLADAHLEVVDLFEIDESEPFDVVTFLGSMPIFQDPEPVLTKLLAICKPGGLLLIDGYFNEYDIDVHCAYRDNSTPEGFGKWRVDWTQHSQSALREFLEPRCRSVEFEEVVMGVELPRNPDAPHINAWTFKDANGKTIITNGTKLMLNDVLMTIRR